MPAADERIAEFEVKLTIAGQALLAKVAVPAGPAPVRVILPILQELTNAVVQIGEERAVAQGRTISCKKGCGACCRQLVPIARAEARQIARLVAQLPADRQQAVRARFADVQQRLADSDLRGLLEQVEQTADIPIRRIGMAYFALQIPCPFLVDESCSIHQDRPLVCREYLVTSPAEWCRNPSEKIQRVDLPGLVSQTLYQFSDTDKDGQARWLPLSLALQWDESHPEPVPEKTGQDLVSDFLVTMAG